MELLLLVVVAVVFLFSVFSSVERGVVYLYKRNIGESFLRHRKRGG